MEMAQFQLAQPQAAQPTGAVAVRRPPPTGLRSAGVRALRQAGARVPVSRLGRAPTAPIQTMRLAGLGFEGMPQGVDLSLEAFNLSEAAALDPEGKVNTWEVIQTSGEVCTKAFWASLTDRHDKDARLLSAIFNPHLSDRRDEGDLFVPPDASASYMRKLQKMVAEEEQVRQRRIEHFRSLDFDSSSPGPLFPASWATHIGIEAKRRDRSVGRKGLEPLPHFRAQEDIILPVLAATQPVFDRRAEDGLRFRIYRVGSLEFRTTQEHDGAEITVEAFSSADTGTQSPLGSVSDYDPVAKGVMYVEHSREGLQSPSTGLAPPRHYFVVLETHSKNMVLTEKLSSGIVRWEENPADLKFRTSLAKVVRSEVAPPGHGIGDMKVYKESCFSEAGASSSKRKRYARGVLRRLARREDVPQSKFAVSGGRGMSACVAKVRNAGRAFQARG